MQSNSNWDLIIKNGNIVLENATITADLAVKDGIIGALGHNLGNASKTIDASGLFVLPGCVDAHVHFNEPRPEPWEGWDYGSRSAAAGGVTTVLEMPLNCVPPVTDPDSWAIKTSIAKEKAGVDYALWGGLINNNLEHLQYLHDRGAVGFKAFTAKALDFPMASDPILYEGMKWAAKENAIIDVHAENDMMTSYYTEEMKSAGRTDRSSFLQAHLEISELEATQRTLLLAKHAGATLHMAHISLAETFEMIDLAKDKQRVTAETCPHYLFFDDTDFEEIGPALKCTPPIRPASNRKALWEKVLSGSVDLIASDYAACPADFKTRGENDIWQAWAGINGIQVMLPAVWTSGAPRGLKPELMAQLLATNPARIFGFYPQKGTIQIGSDADIILFDPNKNWVLSSDMLFSRYKISPYIGRHFNGSIVSTILRGQIIYENGQVFEQRGRMLIPDHKRE